MSPAVRATLQTLALLAFGVGFPLVGVYGPEWLFFFVLAAVFLYGLVMFWRAAYKVEQIRERKQ